ncbi:hypothetical protein ACFQ8C_24860 [Streptomyces sp. NPDC056503]|uniref:DNA polymerase III subunit beta family protein n=1 Tax=Streptomyces sp. NPDC056503 TaxID=3345842 RepID=UPI003690E78C
MTKSAIIPTPTNSAELSGTYANIMSALKTVALGIPSASPVESQSGVLIETGSKTVTFTAFDFETSVSVAVSCSTPETSGTSLLSHTQLVKILGAIVAGETKTTAAQTAITLTGDLLTGGGMTIPITAFDPTEFVRPPLPAPAMATVDAGTFLTQLQRTLPACGSDYTLPLLCGIELTLTGQTLTLAATDRYRFAVAELPAAPLPAADTETTASAVIPGDVLKRLIPVLKATTDPLTIGFSPDGGRVTLTTGQTTISQRAYDGRLPGHRTFFPSRAAVSVSLPRAATTAALKKCASIATAKGDRSCPVSFLWDGDGRLTLAPVLPEDQDRARLTGIHLTHTTEQGDPTVLHQSGLSFNPHFLADTLAAFSGDTLTLHIPETIKKPDSHNKALFTDGPDITGDHYRHLLMGIRLAEGTWAL